MVMFDKVLGIDLLIHSEYIYRILNIFIDPSPVLCKELVLQYLS